MESGGFVEIISLLPQLGLGGIGTALMLVLWLIVVDKRLMLRSDHDQSMEHQSKAHEREVEDLHRQLRRREMESDGWRDIALRNTGLLEQIAPATRRDGQGRTVGDA